MLDRTNGKLVRPKIGVEKNPSWSFIGEIDVTSEGEEKGGSLTQSKDITHCTLCIHKLCKFLLFMITINFNRMTIDGLTAIKSKFVKALKNLFLLFTFEALNDD